MPTYLVGLLWPSSAVLDYCLGPILMVGVDAKQKNTNEIIHNGTG